MRSSRSLTVVFAYLCLTAFAAVPALAQTPGKPAAPAPADKDKTAPTKQEAAPAAETAPPADPAAATEATASTDAAPGVETDVPPNVRLRRLERRVQTLKEQAWRVKARVGMLKEAVLGGGVGGRSVVVHVNKMGGSFRLSRLVYSLDGSRVYSSEDENLYKEKSVQVFAGPLAPGNHTLSVLMVYKGYGYGVFAYLKDYKFTVRASHTFTVKEGQPTMITVVGYERGGVTTKLQDRPAVDFRVTIGGEGAQTTPDTPAAPPAGPTTSLDFENPVARN